ncbi:hypothetical protein EAO73_14680 [Streptomyces sp. col6]|nr:hypothetical protein EAO73_14680 [Streptomyces sp. col6]
MDPMAALNAPVATAGKSHGDVGMAGPRMLVECDGAPAGLLAEAAEVAAHRGDGLACPSRLHALHALRTTTATPMPERRCQVLIARHGRSGPAVENHAGGQLVGRGNEREKWDCSIVP